MIRHVMTRLTATAGLFVASAAALLAAEPPPQSLKDRLPRLAPKEPVEALKTDSRY